VSLIIILYQLKYEKFLNDYFKDCSQLKQLVLKILEESFRLFQYKKSLNFFLEFILGFSCTFNDFSNKFMQIIH